MTDHIDIKHQASDFKRIALLKGGWNLERTVSLQSAASVRKALDELGYETQEFDVKRDLVTLITSLQHFKPDLVFLNALHGSYVEDGKLQAVIEILGYPYTGSGVAASAMGMDKSIARKVFAQNGVRIPKGLKCRAEVLFSSRLPVMPMPFVIKPINEGSSIGVYIIRSKSDLEKAEKNWCYGDELLVEEYIAGHEFSVTLLHNKPLGMLGALSKDRFF